MLAAHPSVSAAAGRAARARANRLGVLGMVGAMGFFVVNDTIVKFAGESLPGAQLIAIRGAMATALIFAVIVAMGKVREIGAVTQRWVLVRSFLDAITTLLFLVALFHLPISTATSINATSPLLITLLAAVVAGERVRGALWAATAIGFAGVLLVIQPGAGGFNLYALVAFLSTMVLAVRDIVTRRVDASVPSIVVTLSTSLLVTLLAGALSLFEGWIAVSTRSLVMLGAAAVSISVAYVLIVASTRRGDLSVIAPFRYSALAFAAVAGFLVWGDVPNALAWCGFALLVGAGVYVLRVEQRARTAPPPMD
ncbi:MAG: DMT family transporter [Burkholderiales bacterium]|nr:DMT family transporter [Burkholderiales bacterium]